MNALLLAILAVGQVVQPGPQPKPQPVAQAKEAPKPPPEPVIPKNAAFVEANFTPDTLFNTAYADLIKNVPPDKRQTTRYLDLTGVLQPDRENFDHALVMTANSMTWRPRIIKGFHYVTPDLIRISLEELGWDYATRLQRYNLMLKAGVTPIDPAKLKRILDIWETFAAADPYFKAPYSYYRGWVNPEVEVSARNTSYSIRFILRANWLLPKLWVEAKQGGFYSAVHLFPPKEADLYKLLGVNIEQADRDPLLRAGGGVLNSIVALHNRELQLLPSLYGPDNMKFVWRTFDVAKDEVGKKNILDQHAGTLDLDGREVIGTLPNGMHWYQLFDANGNQVDVVPQNIALDMRPDPNIRDRNVLTAYKCLACHGPVSGTYPFDDVVAKAALTPGIGLGVIGKDKREVAVIQAALEDYYRSLAGTITAQQTSYANVVKEMNGLAPGLNSEIVVGFFDKYTWALVSPAQGALEMGLPLAAAIDYWRNSGNSQLIVLSGGHDIRRAAWEKSFGEGMLGARYPWEKAKPHVAPAAHP